MLLRRITQHVKDQNWFAVALDFFIVVAGILIAFQITYWNEGRQERQRTERLFERLEVSFGVDAWVANSFYFYHQAVMQNGQLAIDDLTGKHPLSDEDFLIAAYRATQFNRITPTDSTYEELVTTGGLDLVGDTDLGRIASFYYENTIADDIVIDGKSSEYRRLFRTITPIDVQLATATTCGDRQRRLDELMAGISDLSYECVLDLPEETIEAAAKVLREHPVLADALRLRLATLSQQITDFAKLNEAITPYRANREELEASAQFSVFLEKE